MIEIASCTCNQCGEAYIMTQFECKQCASKIQGQYILPRLARLAPDERQFIELFLLTGGNIKKMEKAMGISYPTVKNKLDKIVSIIRRQIIRETGNSNENKSLFENVGLNYEDKQ